jgi:hypothetical protein
LNCNTSLKLGIDQLKHKDCKAIPQISSLFKVFIMGLIPLLKQCKPGERWSSNAHQRDGIKDSGARYDEIVDRND